MGRGISRPVRRDPVGHAVTGPAQARDGRSDAPGGPVVSRIRRGVEVAGRVAYGALVAYPGETPRRVVFVGSPRYGGPVVMIAEDGPQTFVSDPSRFGEFGPDWVRRFYG